MRRCASPRSSAWLIALYAMATLGGPALHALPGCGHAHPLGHHDHDGGIDPRADHGAMADEDCFLCHFLSQGQLAVAPVADLGTEIDQPPPRVDSPIAAPSASARRFHPRAPPA